MGTYNFYEDGDDPGRDFPRTSASRMDQASGCLWDGLPIPCTVASEIDSSRYWGSLPSGAIGPQFSLLDRLRGRVAPTLQVKSDVSSGQHLWVDLSEGFVGAWQWGVGGAPFWKFGGSFGEARASFIMTRGIST